MWINGCQPVPDCQASAENLDAAFDCIIRYNLGRPTRLPALNVVMWVCGGIASIIEPDAAELQTCRKGSRSIAVLIGDANVFQEPPVP